MKERLDTLHYGVHHRPDRDLQGGISDLPLQLVVLRTLLEKRYELMKTELATVSKGM